MATTKTLNTRILLRYDEYTNWYNNNPKLLKGEVAIATIPENHTDPSTGEITQIPAVVMKVGTGAETGSNYRDLPFVSAKAADVLAACKTEDGLKAFVNGVIADAGIASNDAMEALAGRVGAVETKSGANETAIATLKGDENTAGSVAKAIKDAIAALDLANTYEAKGEAAKVQGELNTYKESNDIALANVKATAEAAYVKPTTGIAKDDLAADVKASLGKADTALQEHQDISHLASKTELSNGLSGKVDNSTYTTKVGELETAIGGKVDKVEGKSLIADSEITRLAGVTNYDDTQVKADIAKKADAATMTTELGKKVDKETGKSLVSDTEITKLAGVSEGANKVEASETNGKIKIDGVETVVYTHPEKHTVSEISDFDTAVKAYDYATKAEAKGYADGKDEAIAAAQKAGDDAQDALDAYKEEMITALAGKQAAGDYAAEEHDHTASEITDFATEVAKVKVAEATKADEATKATQDGEGRNIKDTYAEKATTLAGYGIGDAYTKTETEGKISDAIAAFTEAYITTDGGTIDKLQEIADWIVDDKAGAAKVIADVAANAKAIEDHEALAAETYETKEDATAKNTAMDNRVKVLEGINHEAYVAADTALKTELQGKIDAIDNHSHTNKRVLDGITEEKVTAWDAAEQNAKDYADALTQIGDGSATVSAASDEVSVSAMFVDISGDNVQLKSGDLKIELDHGSDINKIQVTGDMQVQAPANDSSVSTKKYVDDALAAAKKYADDNDTDTTYTAKADGGLKLEGTEFSIDDSITFIFDCGSSAE